MSKAKFKATQQQRDASNPQNTVWVTANAGSGKTHVLVERVARLLLSGAEPSAILCITYTKAAAAEMSSRLFNRLSKWTFLSDADLISELTELRQDAPDIEMMSKARRLFARALETPGGLKIQTIHAFCEKLLQQFPVEAGMAPGFSVMNDRDSEAQLADAISDILKTADVEKNLALADAFGNVISLLSSNSFESLIKQFLSNAKGFRNIFSTDLDAAGFSLILKSSLTLPLDTTLENIAAELRTVDVAAYLNHAEILAQIKIHGKHDTARHLKHIALEPSNIDNFRALFLTAKHEPRASLISKGTTEAHPATAEFLEGERQRVVDLLFHYDLLFRIEATCSLFTIAKSTHTQIEHKKRYLGHYDFDDLISRTTALLSSSRAAQWVLYKLDAGLKHVLVDEAQDTSPAQWKIISALVEEFFAGQAGLQPADRTLFVVGDRKQSIYSFQGADIHALAKSRAELSDKITGAGKLLSKVELDISYRSTPEVLAIVDRVFPANQPARLGFAVDDQTESPHQSNRLNEKGIFELWPLIESEDADAEDKPWDAPVDQEPSRHPRRLLARQIAETLKSWIGKRVLVSQKRMIQPDDILILLQSRGPLFSMLISELRKLGVPVAGADRLNLRESLIVQDMLILLQWLLIPQDDYALACVLKGPLLARAITEDDLIELAVERGTLSLWSRLQQTPDENVALLLEHQKQILQGGPYEFFANILNRSRLSIVKRLGTEAIDASNAFLDQALAYQLEHGYSLAGFLHWFEASDTNIKREMEQAAGEVRIMTVHGAKGLEANIVFLGDAASVPTGGRSEPTLLTAPDSSGAAGVPFWVLGNLTEAPILKEWKEQTKHKDQAEHNRLLYVAMTRACDELYVCGVKGKKKIDAESWYATLEAAVGSTELANVKTDQPETTQQPTLKLTHPKTELPVWARTNAAKETGKSIYSLTGLVAKYKAKESVQNPKGQRRGTAIHALLHELSNMEEAQQTHYAKNWAKRLGFAEKEALALLELITAPELSPFFGPNSHSEAELRGTLPDGRHVSGRVDRLNIEEDLILVLDYKSDHFIPESIDELHPYMHQMALYSALLEQAYPNRKIKAALLWTQSAELMWIEPDFLVLPRAEALAELELEAP